MLCPNCSRLSSNQAHKKCIKCNSSVFLQLSVLCENCSATEKKCSICLKKIVSAAERIAKQHGGCNCGKRK